MLDRILALLVVIAAAVVPLDALKIVNSKVAQLILASVVVLWMIFVDLYAGLLLGVALLVAYFRNNSQHILTWGGWGFGGNRNGGPIASLIQDYITPEHLRDAQTNVVDISDYNTEMKGIVGVYGESVYGAQGMDDTMPGFTKDMSLMGDVFSSE